MFIFPAIETESELVIKNPMGKLSACYNAIPVYVIKQRIKYIKKPPGHIYNIFLKSSILTDRFTMAKVKLLHKRGDAYAEYVNECFKETQNS